VRRAFWIGVALAAGAAAPCVAAPRVTLRLENALPQEALARVTEQTGVPLHLFVPESRGGDFGPTPYGRAGVDWRAAPLGQVVRDVCRLYGLTAVTRDSPEIFFQRGKTVEPKLTTANGLGVALVRVAQAERASLVPGASPSEAGWRRTVHLRLLCRALGGDGELIGPVTRLTLIDASGKRQEARLAAPTVDSGPALPDERTRDVTVEWAGEHGPRLQRIEGELALYARVEESRFRVSLTGGDAAKAVPAAPAGPVRMQVLEVSTGPGALRARIRLEWNAGVEVAAAGPDAVRTSVVAGGRAGRVFGTARSGMATGGGRWLELDYAGPVEPGAEALEIVVPAGQGPQRRAAFALENVALPFGQPYDLRLAPRHLKPAPTVGASAAGASTLFRDAEGGSLRLPATAGGNAAEVRVGLSRQAGDGWTAVRWQVLESSGGPQVLRGLAPGTYRVILRSAPRSVDGATSAPPTPDRTATVQIRKGAVSEFPSAVPPKR